MFIYNCNRLVSVLLSFYLGLFFISSLPASEPEKNLIDRQKAFTALRFSGLFDSFNQKAEVYLCEIAAIKPITNHPSETIGRGYVTLKVKETLLGRNRSDNIVLPYSYNIGVLGGGMELVWPVLEHLGGSNLLCVLVPDVEDPGAPTIQGVNEAAIKVTPVNGKNDPAVLEMKTVCDISSARGKRALAKVLRRSLADSRPIVRDFSLQMTVLELGKIAPDEAINILTARATSYKEGRDNSEALRLISFIRGNVGRVEPRDEMNNLLCRCLAAVAQAPSRAVSDKALNTLATVVAYFKDQADFHPLDGLDSPERVRLINAINSASAAGNTNALSLKKWLSP